MTAQPSTNPQTAPAPGPRQPSRLVPWGARCAIAAPIVGIFAIVVGAPLYTENMRTAATTNRLLVANGATLGVLLLLIVGLIALLLRGQNQLGTAGHLGGLGALVGTVLAAGGAWDALFALPYVAEQAPALLDEPTGGTLLVGFIVGYLVLAVGWIAFAAASWRSGATPRGAAIVLILGGMFAILPSPTAVRLLPLALGCALAGRAILRERRAVQD
jgi:hypothetical protein